MTLRGKLTQFCVAAAIGLGAAHAFAAPVISVGIMTSGIYDQYNVSQEGTPNPDGTFSLSGIGYGTDFNCDWSITVNPDPSISGSFNLTNLSPSAQTFVLTVSLPTSVVGPTVMGGFAGDVTYTDASGNGSVTLQTIAGSPFYRALVDGLSVGAIGDLGSFNLTAFGGPGATGTLSQLAFGTPIPSAPGPAGVASNIGIRVTFNLTGGDSVNIPVNFTIDTGRAPEPASLVLVGIGLAALAAARRSRAA
ncbi:MAG TPA: PEP-CTERM sorting domain-containing protein [Myxococcota bacterium]|nr:PEP-CTERM sorting domain-containing protein [Myxococcota bacterium]